MVINVKGNKNKQEREGNSFNFYNNLYIIAHRIEQKIYSTFMNINKTKYGNTLISDKHNKGLWFFHEPKECCKYPNISKIITLQKLSQKKLTNIFDHDRACFNVKHPSL